MNNNLYKLIEENIVKNCNIKIATRKLSLRAFYKLIPLFKICNSIKIILTDFDDYKEISKELTRQYEINLKEKEMLTNEFELKLKNDLMDFYYAKITKEFIEQKVEIKFINKFKKEFILIDNAWTIIDGTSEITLSTFGEVQCDEIIIMTSEKNEQKYNTLLQAFEQSWNSIEKAKDAKKKLLDKLETIYIDKTPYDLYQFTNACLNTVPFNNAYDRNVIDKRKFEETKIYQNLFEFQRHAIESILDKIDKYNGCILADSVGLGKTYEALAIIKYFELQGKKVLVLSPKKLFNNWLTFNSNIVSNPLIEDGFRYDLFAHTDLTREKGWSGNNDLSQQIWDNYDLVVIDESHNFRNGKFNNNKGDWESKRYKKLMDSIILSGRRTSVLLLTATPVNNRMQDINNQINIITANNDNAFINENIKSIKNICTRAEKKSNEWSKLPVNERTIENFQNMIGTEFRKLIDLITIARSRKQIIENYVNTNLKFPNRLKPISKRPNIDSLNQVGDMKALFNELNNVGFSYYKILSYIKPEFQDEYEDEYDWRAKNVNSKLTAKNREVNIISLMRINLLKRFESSIESFKSTLLKILEKTKQMHETIKGFSSGSKKEIKFDNFVDIDEDENEEEYINEEDVIKLNKIKIKDINHIDLIKFESELSFDILQLQKIYDEYSKIDHKRDEKLKILIKQIEEKINDPINDLNKKIIIFTSYTTTAEYLYSHVSLYFLSKNIYTSLVSGKEAKTNHPNLQNQGRKFEHNEILTYFSPLSKGRDKNNKLDKNVDIDILIATDCISEGQNLQDCDFLINYDIHWNPVRLIQRFGRIDRIGSKNNEIQMVNFWPNIKMDEYIKLESRVKVKMTKVSQTSTMDENIFNELTYEEQVKLNQLELLENECPNLEEMKENVSFSSMTFSEYTTDLKIYYDDPENVKKVTNQPDGIFSIARNELDNIKDGVIFLFKSINNKNNNNNNQFDPYYLIYIQDDGKVKYSYSSTAQILSLYKAITKNQKEVNKELINYFNSETNFGKNMDKYVDLLNKSISSLNSSNDSNSLDDLFDVNKVSSNDNFVYTLISFLIIRRN